MAAIDYPYYDVLGYGDGNGVNVYVAVRPDGVDDPTEEVLAVIVDAVSGIAGVTTTEVSLYAVNHTPVTL